MWKTPVFYKTILTNLYFVVQVLITKHNTFIKYIYTERQKKERRRKNGIYFQNSKSNYNFPEGNDGETQIKQGKFKEIFDEIKSTVKINNKYRGVDDICMENLSIKYCKLFYFFYNLLFPSLKHYDII